MATSAPGLEVRGQEPSLPIEKDAAYWQTVFEYTAFRGELSILAMYLGKNERRFEEQAARAGGIALDDTGVRKLLRRRVELLGDVERMLGGQEGAKTDAQSFSALANSSQRNHMIDQLFWSRNKQHPMGVRSEVAHDANRVMEYLAEQLGIQPEELPYDMQVGSMNSIFYHAGVDSDNIKLFANGGMNKEAQTVPIAQVVYFAATRGRSHLFDRTQSDVLERVQHPIPPAMPEIEEEALERPREISLVAEPPSVEVEKIYGLESRVLHVDTAVRTEKSPFHSVNQDAAAAFSYADGKSAAVIACDGISTAQEELSRQAALMTVDTFRKEFEGVDRMLTSEEVGAKVARAYVKAAQDIESMQDEALHSLYTDIAPEERIRLRAEIRNAGTTLNFQTLCMDSSTGQLAVFALNFGDSMGGVIDVGQAREVLKARGSRRSGLKQSAYHATSIAHRGEKEGQISRSVRQIYAGDFLDRERREEIIRILPIPTGVTDIMLLSRTDILDKLHGQAHEWRQEQWIMDRLLEALRVDRRQSQLTTADRFVDRLLRVKKEEQERAKAHGVTVRHDDASFATAHIHIQ